MFNKINKRGMHQQVYYYISINYHCTFYLDCNIITDNPIVHITYCSLGKIVSLYIGEPDGSLKPLSHV